MYFPYYIAYIATRFVLSLWWGNFAILMVETAAIIPTGDV
jgi:hypothetical protein